MNLKKIHANVSFSIVLFNPLRQAEDIMTGITRQASVFRKGIPEETTSIMIF
jgi:hypothetical protein